MIVISENDLDIRVFECFTSDIDDSIREYIRRMNRLGFRTYASCSGIKRDHVQHVNIDIYDYGYVTLMRDEKISLDLLYFITKMTVWDVGITYSDVFGEGVKLSLPYTKDGRSLFDYEKEELWDLLMKILETWK